MNQFDDIFKEQVNSAFDNYNVDQLADSAWKSFQQKKSKSKWLGIAMPLWAKAASVAILLSIGGLITHMSLNNKQNTQWAETTIIDTTQTTSPLPKEPPSIKDELVLKTAKEPQLNTKKQAIKAIEPTSEAVDIVNPNEIIADIVEPKISDSTLVEMDNDRNDVKDLSATTNDSIEPIENPVVIQKRTTLLAFKESEVESERAKKTSFFAGLSGMVANIENMVSSSPGVSMGIYAEHKLTSRISVRPGLALAKNTYEMRSVSPGSDFMFAAPMQNGISGDVLSAEISMDIVAMEIPINFVFNISEKNHRKLFVSAGSSTMIYLSQSFNSSLNSVYTWESFDSTTGTTTPVSNYASNDIETKYGAFSRVDYFGLANLSAGYSFPLGKTSTMLVEPFIQLPMHDITSINLRIRYGGLSLKFSFGK
ncbi:MAG TPA: hypothetical protein DG754_14375 [Bacteroidales bacterium]|jgi:hypothetical protein|nr:hypothetical protein [Bacteroidales bacterium]